MCKPFARSSRQPRSGPASASTSRSSTKANSRYARVGRVVGHFGIRGSIKIAALDAEAFRPGVQVFCLTPKTGWQLQANARRLRLLDVRPHNTFLVVRIEGVTDRAGAQDLIGAHLLMRRADLPRLPARAFRAADIVGFTVRDRALGLLGSVRGVHHYPASDMLVVGERNLLVPMLAAYGMKVDRKKREISVALPPGFEELSPGIVPRTQQSRH